MRISLSFLLCHHMSRLGADYMTKTGLLPDHINNLTIPLLYLTKK